eukprot:TRINITY_DN8147_c0_g1_i1.p1 TRINITY_DN8147_c0_g1~~TRINITY_DN8147_c0_g1_i1.p1  ORF type:complete len:237 (-),score=46.68 TRINITY_DN8147_c0_g1_i1:107-775(-)
MARLTALLVCLACLILSVAVDAARLIGKRGLRVKPKKKTHGEDVDSHLIEFQAMEAESCEYHRAMEPMIERLENDTPFHVKKITVGQRQSEEQELYTLIDAEVQCGGLPFFYNRQSQQSICGATTYKNFRAWASGKPAALHCPPPVEEITGEAAQGAPRPRKGVFGKLKSRMADVKEKGQGQMSKRRGAAPKPEPESEQPAEAQGEEGSGASTADVNAGALQ